MKSFVIEEDLEKCIEKIKLYNIDEKLNVESIIESYNNMSSNYSTSNTSILNSLIFDISQKLSKVNQNHINDCLILSKTLDKYRVTKVDVAEKLDEII